MKNQIIILLILLMILGCSIKSGEVIQGNWKVDYNRSMQKIMKNEIWHAMDDIERDMFPDLFTEMISGMLMNISSNSISIEMNKNELSYPYIVENEDNKEIEISTEIGAEKVTLHFTILDKNHIQFKSSATNDMDYYVWKRVGEGNN